MAITKNARVELDVTRYGMDAQGVAVHEGMTVFVDDALPGERVLAHVMRVEKRFAYARTERVLRPSPARREPPCPYAARCGGCACMHMDYGEQMNFKREQVCSLMKRVGGFDAPVRAVAGMDDPLRYRNKAAVPVGGVADAPVVGFYARRSHFIVEADDCLIARAEASMAARAVRDYMKKTGLAPYDEITFSGIVRHVVTRVSRAGESMVTVCAAGPLPDERGLCAAIRAGVPGVRSIYLCAHTKPDNVILGGPCRLLWGEERLRDTLMGKTFLLSPQSFFQVNPVQTERLYTEAVNACALTGGETVWDLYCGAGTISLALADRAAHVIGVESVEAAVRDAWLNARENGVTNVSFIAEEAERALPRLAAQGRADAVVLDPPRKGAHPDVLCAVADAAPRRVVYVSCNPATQARDLALLAARGYQLNECRPVDMFCYTGDVENVAVMTRREDA